MRSLIAVIIVAALVWSGYWFWGASTRENAVNDWIAARQADGWVTEVRDVTVRGFPNRFDTIVTDLRLADPESGWVWEGNDFEILSLSYNKNHHILRWPEAQSLATPQQKIKLNSKEPRASLLFAGGNDLPVEAFTFEAESLVAESNAGWAISTEKLILALKQAESGENRYDLALDAQGLSPDSSFRQRIDQTGILPEHFETLKMTGTTTFQAPLDRFSLETQPPRLAALTLDDARAQWGEILLQAKGDLVVDDAGYPQGEIALRAKNWRQVISIATGSGALTPEVAAALETGLSIVAALAGNKDTLDLPLSFSNRLMRIGPIPIGPAPRLVGG